MRKFYGVDAVDFISRGEWNDPEVICRGIHANYWDLEEFLWELYVEHCLENGTRTQNELDNRTPAVEDDFAEWVRSADNAGYIDEFFSNCKETSCIGQYHNLPDVMVYRSLYRTRSDDMRDAYVEYDGRQVDLRNMDSWLEDWAAYDDIDVVDDTTAAKYEADIKAYIAKFGVVYPAIAA